jgi:tetratricopeptide (TPR) repeat protein
MTRILKLLAVFLVTCSLVSAVSAKKTPESEDDVDYLALATRLFQDGHVDRASDALEDVDVSSEELDRDRYYLLKGLVALNQKLYLVAVESFELAMEAGNTDPLVLINLARSHFGAKNYKGTVSALLTAGESARAEPSAELLLCQAYWELSNAGMALKVLARATVRFPDAIDFSRLEIAYLIKLQLYQELASKQVKFLERSDVQPNDIVAIGEALRKSARLDEAKTSLESGRLRFPDDIGLSVQLARVYMDDGELFSAGMLLEQVARQDDAFFVESAEMYRRSGRLVRALLINKRVPDQKRKMRQRLQILLELERFEMIAGMEARLSRLGLLADQQIRYALAYGFFQTRDFESAEKHIRHLSDPSFFEKGIALRKAIESCVAAGWLCE